MSPEEKAQAWAFQLMHQVSQHERAVFNASAPIPLPAAKPPELTKPGTRRVPPVPRGHGPCQRWGVR